MIRVFLDASVIFAGLYSPRGGSALILDFVRNKKIKGFASQVVLGEVQRNVVKKIPQKIEDYSEFIRTIRTNTLNEPNKNDVMRWYSVINPKDAHVLASATQAKADYLLTLDRKHFLLPEVQKAVSFNILSPKELIEILSV